MPHRPDDPRRRSTLRIEVDPERVDEAVRTLGERLRRLYEQGRHTKVRFKVRGRPITPDIPLAVVIAGEALTFWSTGLLRALALNLGAGALLEVEIVHDADQRVEEGIERYLAGDVEEAEVRFREALAMRPDDPAALYHLGVVLRVTGRREEAVACFERAAAAADHPDAVRAREVLERLRGGA